MPTARTLRSQPSAVPPERPTLRHHTLDGAAMNSTLRLVLLVIVIALVIGVLPTWGYSHGWGYFPSGGLTLLLVVIVAIGLVGSGRRTRS